MYEKIKNIRLFIVIAVVLIGFGGLVLVAQSSNSNTNSQNATHSAPALSIQTIKDDIKNGGQLIDVRTAEEYTAGHIDGAINLSLQDIQAGTMPTAAKDKPIYVYCHSGNRAGQAATILKAAGYKNIIDLGAITHVQSLGGIIKT